MADPRSPGLVYAGSVNGLFKSGDNGASWISAGFAGQLTRPLATAPPASVYVATGEPFGAQLFVSADGGGHWSPLLQASFTRYDLVVDPFASTTLYLVTTSVPPPYPGAIGGSSLSRSTDGGATWVDVSFASLNSSVIVSLVADPSTHGVLYLATEPARLGVGGHGIFKTSDSGSTWTLVNAPLGYVSSLAVDPKTPSTIYAGSKPGYDPGVPGGVLKSTDGGATFLQMNNGLAGTAAQTVEAIRIDPVRPNRIFIATAGGGVLASLDAGASWQPLNAGLTDPLVWGLAIDSAGTNLHAATNTAVFDYEFVADPAVLSLYPGRLFGVSLTATDQRTGRTGSGLAIPVSDIFGYFSIPAITSNPANPEVFVKMLDGTAINGEYWFFYGGLTDLEYTLTITDVVSGQVRRYTKPGGSECGGSDTAAFTP